MANLNITNQLSLDQNYARGLLPQRNQKNVFYQESSSRSNLAHFALSSENRRILRKTEGFSFNRILLSDFNYTPQVQKTIHSWIKSLGWVYPTSSIRTVFTNHIFNYVYVWRNESGEIVAYAICLITDQISHIAYVFYNPEYSHGNLPIRLVLQAIIDSHDLALQYCYLGRFAPDTGFYKRNMPGFEYFDNGEWNSYNTSTDK